MLEVTANPIEGSNYYKTLLWKDGPRNLGSLILDTWAMQNCGLGTLQGFNSCMVPLGSFDQKAQFLAHLYKLAYQPGNLLYSLSGYQLRPGEMGKAFHDLFLTLGSAELTHFKNLTHAPSMIHLFHVNIRRGVGMYFDEYGDPIAEQRPLPEPAPVVAPTSGWMYLPKKEN